MYRHAITNTGKWVDRAAPCRSDNQFSCKSTDRTEEEGSPGLSLIDSGAKSQVATSGMDTYDLEYSIFAQISRRMRYDVTFILRDHCPRAHAARYTLVEGS